MTLQLSASSNADPRSRGGQPTSRTERFLRSDLGHYIPLVAVVASVLAVDQWSKNFVTQYVDASGQGQIAILGGKVLINPINNPGAAFGVLPNQTILLTVVAVAIMSTLVFSYRRLAHAQLALRLGLGLVLGGALGNLLDRVRFGHVIDFIDLRWWPVFNVADSCIVVGVVTILLTFALQAERRIEQ